MSSDLIHQMAQDVGVVAYAGETAESFISRVLYSACRWWAEAICLSDDCDGTRGAAKKTITDALRNSISNVATVQGLSGVPTWAEKPRCIYDTLQSVGDLVATPEGDRLRATVAECWQVSPKLAVMTGVYDPTIPNPHADGGNTLVCSGLVALLHREGEDPLFSRQRVPLEVCAESLAWSDSSKLGRLEHIKLNSTSWSILKDAAWGGETPHRGGMTLSRTTNANDGAVSYYFTRRGASRLTSAQIDWQLAQLSYFHFKSVAHHRARCSYAKIDQRHIRLRMPLGLIDPLFGTVLSAMVWPSTNPGNDMSNVARVEALEAVVSACEASELTLEERG